MIERGKNASKNLQSLECVDNNGLTTHSHSDVKWLRILLASNQNLPLFSAGWLLSFICHFCQLPLPCRSFNTASVCHIMCTCTDCNKYDHELHSQLKYDVLIIKMYHLLFHIIIETCFTNVHQGKTVLIIIGNSESMMRSINFHLTLTMKILIISITFSILHWLSADDTMKETKVINRNHYPIQHIHLQFNTMKLRR